MHQKKHNLRPVKLKTQQNQYKSQENIELKIQLKHVHLNVTYSLREE